MTEINRRDMIIAVSGSMFPLSGCTSVGKPDDDVEQFVDALEDAGIPVEDTMGFSGSGLSVMYLRDPDEHRVQIFTISDVFVEHREVVEPDGLLSVTALKNQTDRAGVFHITRGWAEQRFSGAITPEQYHGKVLETYETR